MYTPQKTIKNFITSLANHSYGYSSDVGLKMLDDAVKASSKYNSIQEVIDAMKADQLKAEKEAVEEVLGSSYAGKTIAEISSSILSEDAKNYDTENKGNAYFNDWNDQRTTVERLIKERKAFIFLEKYCGIQLANKYWINSNDAVICWTGDITGNLDTGAITGSDANITLKAGDVVNDRILTATDLQTLAKQDGTSLSSDGQSIVIGTGVEKTDRSVVPGDFVNTYVASTSAAQSINTGTRDWVIQATAYNDTINSSGADSISSGAGDDSIIANADGATITSGSGSDTIAVSASVRDITITDLNSSDEITISGTFEVGSAQIEDMLLVITDKTGKRKIRLGDLDTAKNGKINGTTIATLLNNAGINIDSLNKTTYAEKANVVNYSGKAVSSVAESDNLSTEEVDGRTEIALDWKPSPVVEKKAIAKTTEDAPNASSNLTNTNSNVTVNLDEIDKSTAGDVSVNGVKVGAVSSTFPNAQTFTRKGLTIHLLGEVTKSAMEQNIAEKKYADDPSRITFRTFDELTQGQKTIIASIFKWWGNNCLTLNEDSYGIGFESSTAAVTDIGLYFYDDTITDTTNERYGESNDGNLAVTWSRGTSGGDGNATRLLMSFNLHYYNNLSVTDMNGESTVNGAGFLPRTAAHELTHANMATNIDYFALLPKFIKEGAAELTHGTDDERGNSIFKNAYDDEWLDASLDLENKGTGGQAIGDGYSGGYMFLRYFARNVALQSLFDPTEFNYTEGDDSINNTVSGVVINALGGNDHITNEGSDVSINAGAGNDFIKNNGANNVEINGGLGEDTINVINSENVTVYSGGKISLVSSKNNYIKPGSQDAIVYGFNWTDTLQVFHPSCARETIGSNLILKDMVSDVTLVGCASIPAELLNITGIPTGSEVELVEPCNQIENFNSSTLISGDTGYFGKIDSIVSHGENVTIVAGEEKDTVEVYGGSTSVSGGDGDDIIVLDSEYSPATLNGDSGDDKIIIRNGYSVLVNGGDGNDKITVEGQGQDTIFGNAGEDSIINNANFVTIDGGSDSDSVKSFGSNASIKATDSDKIYLLDGSNSTVNLSSGDNFIYNDKASARNTFVVTGSGSQTISGLNELSSLIFGDGSDTYTKETLNNGNLFFKTNTASVTVIYSSNFQTFGTEKIVNPYWTLNGTVASFGTPNNIYFTLEGLNPNVKLSDLVFNKDTNVITLSNAALGQSKVELLAAVDSPYKLALASDVKEVQSIPAGFAFEGTTAIYHDGSGTTEGYKLSDDALSIQFYQSRNSQDLFSVLGVTSAEGLSLSGKRVTVSKKSLGTKQKISISDSSYTLELKDSLVSNINFAQSNNKVTLSGTNAGYKKVGNAYEWQEKIGGETLTITGLKSDAILTEDMFTRSTEGKITFKPTQSLLPDNFKTITISEGVIDTSALTTTVAVAAHFDGNTYVSTKTASKWTTDASSVNYTAAKPATNLFTLSGVKTTSGISVDNSKKTATLSAANLNKKNVTFSENAGSYTLALNGVSAAKKTAAHFDGNTYVSASNTLGYAVDSNKTSIKYTAAKSATNLFGLSGVKTTSGISVNNSKKVATLSAANLNKKNVTFSENAGSYTLALNGVSAAKKTAAHFDGNTYVSASNTLGYAVDSNKTSIKYTAAKSATNLFGLSGVKTTSGIVVNNSKKTATLSAANLNKKNVTFSENAGKYTLALNDNVDTTKEKIAAKWTTLKNGNVAYQSAGTGDFYSLNSKKTAVSYNASVAGAIKVEFSGVKGTPTISGGTVKLTASNFKSNVSVASNAGGYKVSLSGDFKGKTFSATAGKDSIVSSGKNITIAAGKGNDKVTLGSGNTFFYAKGDGNDTLYNFSSTAKIKLSGTSKATPTISSKNDDVVFTTDGGKITVKNAAQGTAIKVVNSKDKVISNYTYTTDGIADGKSITLNADFSGSFDAKNYKKVDGSNVSKPLTIIGSSTAASNLNGGKGDDFLIGGKKNDTITGGKGNDSFWGGKGKDTFIFCAADGKDTIMDYDFNEGDMLKILQSDGKAAGSFTSSTFSKGNLKLNILGGGAVIFDDVSKGDTFNINNKTYTFNGKKLNLK